jgi:hypothetical protein
MPIAISVGQIHDAHAAAAEFLDERVSADERLLKRQEL